MVSVGQITSHFSIYVCQEFRICKGSHVSKIIAVAKADARAVLLIKKVHWFFSYVCNRKFVVFLGDLLRDNL